MKLKKWIRRFAFLLVGLGLLAIVLYFAAQKYAKNKVIAVIQEIVGGPVEVDDVRLGRDQIEVRGIRVYESEGDKTAWLTIDKAVLGLTLSDAIRGETIPESASIHGANVVLEYDENRKLLTDFSLWQDGVEMRLKEIDVHDTNLEIRQQGRTPLIVKHIDGTIRGTTKEIQARATGEALDTDWKIDARVDGASFATTCELTTERLRFSTDELTKLPFFPPDVGEEIRATGVTPIQLELRIGERGNLEYRLEMSPNSLDLTLIRAELAISDAAGEIIVQNDRLAFNGLQGTFADGRFSGNGKLSKQNERWTGQVQGTVDGVPLGSLPNQWQVPEQLRGTASGQGVLNVELGESYVEIRGTANAIIDQAQLAGIPTRPVKIGVALEKLRKSFQADEATMDGLATVEVDVADVELAKLLKEAEIDVTEFDGLTGRISFQATLGIPLATVTDRKTYRAVGKLASSGIQVHGIPFSDVAADFEFKDGVASVRNLNTRIAESGQLRGSFRVEVQPLGNIVSDITFERMPVALLEKLVGPSKMDAVGFLSGEAHATVPLESWKNLDLWQASGQMQSTHLSLNEQRLEDVDVTFDIHQGRLAVMNGAAKWKGTKIEASGDLRLKSPYAYSIDSAVRNVDIETAAEIAKIDLPVEVAGQGSISANVTGELEPLSWTASGDAVLNNLTVEKLRIESPTAHWQADAKRLQITSAEAKVLGGSIKLKAEIPLDAETVSNVTGTFSSLDSDRLRRYLPDVPVVVSGKVSGEFSLIGIEKLDTATGTLSVRDLAAQVYGVHVDDVTVDLSLLRQEVDAMARGKTLGGTVSLTTKVLLKNWKRDRDSIPLAARVSAEGIQLSKVWPLAGRQMQIAPPEGVANIQLDLEIAGPSRTPTGVGRLVLHDVRWQGKPLASQLSTNIVVLKDSLVLRDLKFDFGRGRISSTVVFRLDDLGSGTYFLTVENVALRALLVGYPELARDASGVVYAGLRGRFANQRIEGSGKMQLASGRVVGIPVNRVKTVTNWVVDLPSGRGKADIRMTSAEISQGRATGELSLQWGRQLTLKGKANLSDIDLRSLARATPSVSDQLSGRMSGTVGIQGRNVRSVDDLAGTYELQVKDSQLLRLPALNALTNVTGIGSASNTFSDTEIKGRLNRGVFQIDRMTMVGARIQMFIQGSVTTRGKLDLEVTADTAELLALGVVAGIIRPWDWLSRRLIFLRVGGTVRSPVVLPQTEKFIQQEVMRFFLPFVGVDF